MRDWAEGRTKEVTSHLGLLLDLAFDGVTGTATPA